MNAKREDLTRVDIPRQVECGSDRDIFSAALKHWRQRLGYCSIFAAIPAIFATDVSEARSDEVKRTEPSVVGRVAPIRETSNKPASNRALLKRQSAFRLPHQEGHFNALATFAGNDDCPGRLIPAGAYSAAAPFVESGDTTGANNTLNRLSFYYYYSQEANGPDHVYSFTLTSRGQNPQIQVSATSGLYRPLIYVLQGSYPGVCPAGTGNFGELDPFVMSISSNGGTATLDAAQLNKLPLNVPLHLLIDSARNDSTGSGPYTIRIQDVTISGNGPCSKSNVIDCPAFFVRQHYLDFLTRIPDTPGQGFWTGNITRCTDPSSRPAGQTEVECNEKQMVTTSAAFFLSPEFQYTGYFVYRLYKGSLIHNGVGRAPNYLEFLTGIWEVNKFIIQNNQLHAPTLEANKKAFAEAFANRGEFHTLYDPLSNVEYVDSLFQTTGINATAAEKQELVQGLNNKTETRASVLQKVVDGTVVIAEGNQQFTTRYGRAFYEKEFNAAFVLMQYFGYLQRDPDPAGYQHWLDKLNYYGNYLDAEMVKSFITSPEYRARFAQP